MTPDQLAILHRAAFTTERPWTAAEFAELLESQFVRLHPHPAGFALSRTIAGESELLTVAVHPDHQRTGIGRAVLRQWLSELAPNTESAFLEVAADNTAAITLYAAEGFAEIARRAGYYARKNAAAADALVMRRDVTFGQAWDSSASGPESG